MIDGGPGNDVLGGSSGMDLLVGGDGNDRLLDSSGELYGLGGKGNDVIESGSGNDAIDGEGGSDAITSRGGNDLVSGWSGSDRIRTGAGDDVIFADPYSCTDQKDGSLSCVFGDDGNVDTVSCGAGRDIVYLPPEDTANRDCEQVNPDPNAVLDSLGGTDPAAGGATTPDGTYAASVEAKSRTRVNGARTTLRGLLLRPTG